MVGLVRWGSGGDRSDSQADSAGSIPVTRSTHKGPGQGQPPHPGPSSSPPSGRAPRAIGERTPPRRPPGSVLPALRTLSRHLDREPGRLSRVADRSGLCASAHPAHTISALAVACAIMTPWVISPGDAAQLIDFIVGVFDATELGRMEVRGAIGSAASATRSATGGGYTSAWRGRPRKRCICDSTIPSSLRRWSPCRASVRMCRRRGIPGALQVQLEQGQRIVPAAGQHRDQDGDQRLLQIGERDRPVEASTRSPSRWVTRSMTSLSSALTGAEVARGGAGR